MIDSQLGFFLSDRLINWFTNARVRLWKPMVEEMHALERKTQCAKVPDAPQITSALADQQISVHSQSSQREFQICSATGQDSWCKHNRIEALPGVEQSKDRNNLAYLVTLCRTARLLMLVEATDRRTC